jgi:predicted RNase H-like HicB family nuclease
MEARVLQRTIKAVIRPGDESGFVGECLEIPVVTQGRTLDEVCRNLREAVELHLADEDLEALGLSPDPTIIVTMELTPEHA